MSDDQSKTCTRCLEEKPISSFYTEKRRRSDGTPYRRRRTVCIACYSARRRERLAANPELRRRHNARYHWIKANDPTRYALYWGLPAKLRKYGIDEAFLEAHRRDIGGLCRICRRDLPLVLDHDHKTNRFRGLVCAGCNSKLGGVADSVEWLERAIAHLLNPVGPPVRRSRRTWRRLPPL
ncbi:endonuclease domain-containing protein [Nocardioides ganghwensis]|uniref:Recombination endonuclease VII n=1 Tax=Nocardioides ganghwensis TaxID=252230 RepID=A0A4Q2S6X3_9ACTN|nr:endonuclease domain-containing protein [Nocardioides ganghwensis]MBD3947752.1 hypothetical protein [Nocardioides ganghwensis]RYB98081.1 hypothetical protein EUA07_18550 [Nocardioides ganghwensis]